MNISVAAMVTGTASSAGSFTLAVTVMDDAGLRSSTDARFTVSAGETLDIDGEGKVAALTDGVLAVRYLFGFDGAALTGGALGTGVTRTSAAALKTCLQGLSN